MATITIAVAVFSGTSAYAQGCTTVQECLSEMTGRFANMQENIERLNEEVAELQASAVTTLTCSMRSNSQRKTPGETRRTVTVDARDLVQAGSIVTGGGCETSFEVHNPAMVSSIPLLDTNGVTIGWTCGAGNPPATPVPTSVTAHVITCNISR